MCNNIGCAAFNLSCVVFCGLTLFSWFVTTEIYCYIKMCTKLCVHMTCDMSIYYCVNILLCYNCDIYICPNNLPSQLSPQWLCGNSCTWLGHM